MNEQESSDEIAAVEEESPPESETTISIDINQPAQLIKIRLK